MLKLFTNSAEGVSGAAAAAPGAAGTPQPHARTAGENETKAKPGSLQADEVARNANIGADGSDAAAGNDSSDPKAPPAASDADAAKPPLAASAATASKPLGSIALNGSLPMPSSSSRAPEDASYYARDLVRVHDPRYRWTYKMFADKRMDSSIHFAFRSPFLNPYHWPADPFRGVVSILRRKELVPEMVARDDLPSPGRKDEVRFAEDHNVTLSSLHNSRMVGQSYLEPLTSLAALRRAEDLLQAVRKYTGDLPQSSNSNGVLAQFVDLIHVGSAVSDSVQHHRVFQFNVLLEGVFSGESLEECLVAFIRRIIEEGSRAEESESVLCAKIRVSPRQSDVVPETKASRSKVFVFYPSETTSAKKGAILSTMKAAAIDGGTIALEMYMLTNRLVAALRPESEHLRESVHGYTLVTRKYNFSFIDTGTKVTRCFSRNPYETIASYVFPTSLDADFIRDTLTQHFEGRSKQLAGDSFKRSIRSFIREYLYRLSTNAVANLDAGEIVACMENLLVFIAHGCSSSGAVPYLPLCGQRMTSITRGLCGYLRSVRDAIDNAKSVCCSLTAELNDFLDLRRLIGRGVLPHGMMERITLMQHRQVTFPKALSSIRNMLLGIMRDVKLSEMKYISGEIERYSAVMNGLYHNLHVDMHRLNQMSRIRDDKWERNIFRPQFGDVYVAYLRKVFIELERMSGVLSGLETSVSADLLFELVQVDVAQRGAVMTAFDGNSRRESSSESKQRMPVTLEELLGFVFNLYNQGDIHAVRWYGLQLTAPLQRIIFDPSNQEQLPQVGKTSTGIDFSLFEVDAEERAYSMRHSVAKEFWAHINDRHSAKKTAEELAVAADAMARRLVPSDVSKLFRVYPALSAPWQGRMGGMNAVAALIQEAQRYDCPRAVAEEATRMRYLVETGAFCAMRESLREVLFQNDRIDPYSTICAGMCKYSAQLLAQRHTRNEIMSRFVLCDSQSKEELLTDEVHEALSGPYRLGYHKLAIETGLNFGKPYNERHGAANLRGGIFGPVELLSGLANWRAVFMNSWLLPPLLTRPQYQVRGSDGTIVEYFGGIAGETAVYWATPQISRISAERRDRGYGFKPVEDGSEDDAARRNAGLFGSWFGGSRPGTDAPTPSSQARVHPTVDDSDAWGVDAAVAPVVEIVIKVTKSSMQHSDRARDIFSEEVISNIEGLLSHSRWTVHEVTTNSLTRGSSDFHEDMGVETTHVTAYPHSKRTSAASDSSLTSLPPWVTPDFLSALRTNGECRAECALLMGLHMYSDAEDVEPRLDPQDPDSYDFVDFDGLTSSESAMVARDCETRRPNETVPKMYPALISHLKYVSSAARMEYMRRLERRAARLMQYSGDDEPGSDEDEDMASFDKWWGGGEGWRGGSTDQDTGKNLDPTCAEHHRLSVDSYTAEYVQDVLGLRSDSPRVYIPCTVRFSLLCYSTHQDEEEGADAPVNTSGAVHDEHDFRRSKGLGPNSTKLRNLLKKSIMSTVAISTMQKATQGLVIGNGRVITRLIGSTVWLSPEAAFGIWSCIPKFKSAKQRDSILNTLLTNESNTRAVMARRKCSYWVPDAIGAYKDAAIAVLLTGAPSDFTSYYLDAVKMMESLAQRAAGVASTLRLLRYMLNRPASGLGDFAGRLSIEGVATTIVINVSLCARLVIAAPQCVHFHGACYKILQTLHDLEALLELGTVPLAQGMRNYRPKTTAKDQIDDPPKWSLPLPDLPPSVRAEFREKNVLFDGSSGLRRVMNLRGADFDASLALLHRLESMCGLLAAALTDDVRAGCTGGAGGIEEFIFRDRGSVNFYDADKHLAARVRKARKRKTVKKPKASADPISSSSSESDDEAPPEPHPDMDVFLGISATGDDHGGAASSKGNNGGSAEDDTVSNPRVLQGRSRVPRQERLAQLAMRGGANDGGMIDELRGVLYRE